MPVKFIELNGFLYHPKFLIFCHVMGLKMEKQILNDWKTKIKYVNEELKALPPFGNFQGGIDYHTAKSEFNNLICKN